MKSPIALSSAARSRTGVRVRLPGPRGPGRVLSSSALMVRKNLSILPPPWGRPTVEWMILMCRAMAVRSGWWLMKSEPWSTCKICRQPRPIRLPISSEDEDVEFGVVGLPGLVGVFGAAAEDELVLIPVGHRPFQSQGDKGRIESLDDFPHRRVARRR